MNCCLELLVEALTLDHLSIFSSRQSPAQGLCKNNYQTSLFKLFFDIFSHAHDKIKSMHPYYVLGV